MTKRTASHPACKSSVEILLYRKISARCLDLPFVHDDVGSLTDFADPFLLERNHLTVLRVSQCSHDNMNYNANLTFRLWHRPPKLL